jgi:hypothetical protein
MALFDKKMHDPVQATARVVDNNGLASIRGQAIHCPLDLMVEGDGLPAARLEAAQQAIAKSQQDRIRGE